ncbi:DMT family transporter [bacterium]|jgi:transporter family-2 protein|nr:DMT family transporter [bacterium]
MPSSEFFFSKIVPFIVIVVAGVALSVQVAVNSRLRFGVDSPILSAVISFAVGLLLLALLISLGLFGGAGKGIEGMKTTPSWAFVGGMLGAFYVLMAIFVLPKLGTVITIAGTIFGQQVAAMLIDSNGWLGVTRTPLSLTRVVGSFLLLLGVILIQLPKENH